MSPLTFISISIQLNSIYNSSPISAQRPYVRESHLTAIAALLIVTDLQARHALDYLRQ